MAKKNKNVKQIRLGLNISPNDLAHKQKKIDEFLEKGLRVKVSMRVFGRAKYIHDTKDVQTDLEAKFADYKIINSWFKNNNYYLFIDGKKK